MGKKTDFYGVGADDSAAELLIADSNAGEHNPFSSISSNSAWSEKLPPLKPEYTFLYAQREKRPALLPALMAGIVSASLFYGPNSGETESIVAALLLNVFLNIHFSVEPIYELPGHLKTLGKSLWHCNLLQFSQKLADELLKYGLAYCASDLYVALKDAEGNEWAKKIPASIFFLAFIWMSKKGIEELTDTSVYPFLKHIIRQTAFLLPTAAFLDTRKDFVINAYKVAVTNAFSGQLRNTIVGLNRTAATLQNQTLGNNQDNKVHEVYSESAHKNILSTLRNYDIDPAEPYAIQALSSPFSMGLLIIVIYSFLGFNRDTMPSKALMESNSPQLRYTILVAAAGIISTVGISKLMCDSTTQEAMNSARNIANGIPPIKGVPSWRLYLPFAVITAGISVLAFFSARGSLILNEKFQDEVSPAFYMFVTICTYIGSIIFNTYAAASVSIGAIDYSVRYAKGTEPTKFENLEREFSKGSTKEKIEMLFALSEHDTMNNPIENNKIVTAIRYALYPLGVRVTENNVKFAFKQLSEGKRDDAFETLTLNNDPTTMYAAWKDLFVSGFMKSAMPGALTWFLQAFLLQHDVFGEQHHLGEDAHEYMALFTSYTSFSLVMLMITIVDACTIDQDDAVNITRGTMFKRTLKPMLFGGGAQIIMHSLLGPSTGYYGDDINAPVAKGVGVAAAAFASVTMR